MSQQPHRRRRSRAAFGPRSRNRFRAYRAGPPWRRLRRQHFQQLVEMPRKHVGFGTRMAPQIAMPMFIWRRSPSQSIAMQQAVGVARTRALSIVWRYQGHSADMSEAGPIGARSCARGVRSAATSSRRSAKNSGRPQFSAAAGWVRRTQTRPAADPACQRAESISFSNAAARPRPLEEAGQVGRKRPDSMGAGERASAVSSAR